MQSKKVPGTSGNYQNADSGRTNNSWKSWLGMSNRALLSVCAIYLTVWRNKEFNIHMFRAN